MIGPATVQVLRVAERSHSHSHPSGINALDYPTWLLKNTKALQTSPHTFMPWDYQDQNR